MSTPTAPKVENELAGGTVSMTVSLPVKTVAVLKRGTRQARRQAQRVIGKAVIQEMLRSN